MKQEIIKLTNLVKCFYTDEIETTALNKFNISIMEGEYVSISGPSGCGKSTILSLLGLLSSPTSGSYELAGQEVTNLTANQRAALRNSKIGFIFQSFNLIGEMTVAENVELPLTYKKGLSAAERQARVKRVLEQVEMGHRMNHKPNQLSGGQQQRVAIARALVNNPKMLLADEPTGNLDSKNAQIVMDLLAELNQQGATICMVTHDPRSAEQASRRINLFDGKLVSETSKAHDNAA